MNVVQFQTKDCGGFCKYAGVTSCSPPQLINTPSLHNSLGSNADLFIPSPHYLFIYLISHYGGCVEISREPNYL